MPELPDVEAARCYLIASGLVGSTVTGVDVLWPRAVYRITADAFARGVSSQTVVELARRAKYLLFRLAPSTTKRAPKSPETSRTTLIVHLGMTGGLLLAPSSQPRPRFCTAVFTLDRAREIRFTDPRKLGHLWLVSDETEVTGKLGPEPLEPEFTPRVLAGIVAGKATPIKALLLDQAAIAGIGNIYADEALFAARIAPTKQAAALTSAEVNRLHRAIREILPRATDFLAERMPFTRPPTESAEGRGVLAVPRKEGAPCSRCGKPVERVVLGGRSAYSCPKCQPSLR